MIDCVIKKSRIWFFVTKILNRWMNISLSTNQFKWKRFKCKDKVVLYLSLKSSSLLNKVVKGISPSLYTTGKRAGKKQLGWQICSIFRNNLREWTTTKSKQTKHLFVKSFQVSADTFPFPCVKVLPFGKYIKILKNTWWDLVLHCYFRIFICTCFGKKISKFGTSNICFRIIKIEPKALEIKIRAQSSCLQRHPHLWKNPRLWHRQRRPQRLHLGVFLKQLTYLGWPGCFFFKLLTDDIANIGNIVILQ